MLKYLPILVTIPLLFLPLFFSESNSNDPYLEWKQKHPITLSNSQDVYRRNIFNNNLALLQSHNSNPYRNYDMGVNQFTIYSDQEFAYMHLSNIAPPTELAVDPALPQAMPPTISIDWVTVGKVTPVGDQGQCGAGYAFATTSLLQSWSLVKGNSTKISLSKQQLVDCTVIPYHNHGCNGGWPYVALKYIKDKGITSDIDYPYAAKSSSSCRITGGSFKIQDYTNYTQCSGLVSALNQTPVAVMVGATDWKGYKSGVLGVHDCKRGNTINHSVLLVGIINNNWKLKNSWGTEWGQAGYIRLASGNTCGICNYAGAMPK